MHLDVQPLDDATWPGLFTEQSGREPSRFTSSWRSTLELLDRELSMAVHRSNRFHAAAVLEVPFPSTRIYRDGSGVHADARNPRHPGVALSFVIPEVGPVRFATDRYQSGGSGYLPDWQANVRAIALGLEALRSVDRYGITRRAEQYRGWHALGDGAATSLGTGLTKAEAIRVLYDAADVDQPPPGHTPDLAAVRSLYRQAARRHHPDVGGDPVAFALITEARELLERES